MRRRYPILKALAAQGAALVAVALVVVVAFHGFQLRLPFIAVVALQAALAVALGVCFGLRRIWILFHVAFVPALVGLHALAVPAWAWFAAFLFVLLLNWNSFRHGVPLYLTGSGTNHALAELLRERRAGFRFIDLGSGLAGTLCQLARVYPKSNFTGVETAPLSFALSWLRSLPLRNCRIRYRSLWREPLADYDVVYCFLSPIPMPALWTKARGELKPGSWLVGNTFGIPGVVPDREIPVAAARRPTSLLVWKR
jgi:hypothetical protein